MSKVCEVSEQSGMNTILEGISRGDLIGGPRAMAGLLADSLKDNRGFNADDVLRRYLGWWIDEGFDTGQVSEKVFELMSLGMPNKVAVARVHDELGGFTAGCNPAHRIAPLAACMEIPDYELESIAKKEARLTHYDPIAGDVSATVVVLIRLLMKGVDWDRAKKMAARGQHVEIQTALRGPSNINQIGYAVDVLAASIHFLDRYDSFDDALEASIKFAGPSNFCPVLVGSIGSVKYEKE